MKYIIYYEDWIEEKIEIKSWIQKIFLKPNKKKEISFWLLELNEKGSVRREISFNSNGEIDKKAPYGRNRGEWVDSNVELDYKEYKQIDMFEFDNYWNSKH